MSSSIHQPKLSTIRLVEQKLMREKSFSSRYQLYLSLNNSVMYPTIKTILNYLEESKKIAFKKDGSFVWIFKDSVNKNRSNISKPVRK